MLLFYIFIAEHILNIECDIMTTNKSIEERGTILVKD